MNQSEIEYFNEQERQYVDATSLPLGFLLKSLFIKLRRNTWSRLLGGDERFTWTVQGVSDAVGPADNVRNYNERRTLRELLSNLTKKHPIRSACEVGCGYGRLIMVLGEFTGKVVGFEREAHLVKIAGTLLPAIEFRNVKSLDKIAGPGAGPFDFAMTCTVLQHLTDDHCRKVLEEMRKMTPEGHVLLIEKTKAISVTENTQDGDSFLSRARSVEDYERMMSPYRLVSVSERILEPTYSNPEPGNLMLFRNPALRDS